MGKGKVKMGNGKWKRLEDRLKAGDWRLEGKD
jgi:hypothetical protein